MIGANEAKTSKSFLKRVKSSNKGYADKCPTSKHQWAEIKSSLLMKYLTHDTYTHGRLAIFLQGIITRFLNMFNRSLTDEINEYMAELQTAKQKDKVRSYPVAQSPAWKNDPTGLWNDPHALINVIKWMWYKLKYGGYYNINECQKNPVFVYTAMDIFQQHIIIFHDMIRGDRLDIHKGTVKNDQIGITNILIPFLTREVYGKKSYRTEPWEHPGNVQCFVPYRGKYGHYMKKFAKEDSFYASLQCGLSGSTQYILFLFLLSMKDFEPDPYNDIRDIIITACLYLVGDGGHNIREVIFGLTCSIIILNTFIQDLKADLQNTFKNQLGIKHNLVNVINNPGITYSGILIPLLMKTIEDTVNTIQCNKSVNKVEVFQEVFVTMIKYCSFWENFVTVFYNYTSEINIVGVYSKDLDNHDPSILRNKQQSKYDLKISMYNALFYRKDDIATAIIHSPKSYDAIQIFMALDNDRYKLDPKTSFKRKADAIITDVIKNLPSGNNIINNVNKKLDEFLNICRQKYNNNVPFAFKRSTRKSRRRRSRKKSVRRSRKRKSRKRKSRKRSARKRSARKRSVRKSRRRRSRKKSARKSRRRRSRKRSTRKSRRRSRKRSVRRSRKKRSRKKCIHGIKIDGNCKKKPGPKMKFD